MNILAELFSRKKTRTFKRSVLNSIRKILMEYSRNTISVHECITKISALTTEIILILNRGRRPANKTHDTVLIMAANFFALLYMDRQEGFDTIGKKQAQHRVSVLTEEILNELFVNAGLKGEHLDVAIDISDDFIEQLAEAYFRAGIEGCYRFTTSSLYSVLLSDVKNQNVNRNEIEKILRSIQAEEYLQSDYDYDELSLELMS